MSVSDLSVEVGHLVVFIGLERLPRPPDSAVAVARAVVYTSIDDNNASPTRMSWMPCDANLVAIQVKRRLCSRGLLWMLDGRLDPSISRLPERAT